MKAGKNEPQSRPIQRFVKIIVGIQLLVSQQAALLVTVSFGASPAGAHERDLVDDICNVVDHVQVDVINRTQAVTKEVACRVNSPADCDNHAHVVERSFNWPIGAFSSQFASFATENLEQNEKPTEHAQGESRIFHGSLSLAYIWRQASQRCQGGASKNQLQ